MSDIFLTSGLTIIGGVFVFVIGQYISRFILEPLAEFRRTVEKIEYNLDLYSNVYTNVGADLNPDRKAEASNVLRELACDLRAKARSIDAFRLMEFLGRVPRREKIIEASGHLIYLSNVIFAKEETSFMNNPDNYKKCKNIRTLLDVDKFWIMGKTSGTK